MFVPDLQDPVQSGHLSRSTAQSLTAYWPGVKGRAGLSSHLSEQLVQLTNDVRGRGLSKQTGVRQLGKARLWRDAGL